jgi:hypothetical protein
MIFEDLKNKVNLSIEEFIDKEHYLLENNLNERAITARLMLYLQKNFPEYDVDCEYNKDINNRNLRYSKLIYIDTNNTKKVYPDIIIHKRGLSEKNLLVIEVKKQLVNQKVILKI